MMKSTQGAIRSRKSHHKSRLGCGNCKKRRIKCDEKKPACIKCTNHSIECDFSSEAASSSDSPSSETAAHVSSTARFRFKPSKYQSEKRTSLDETAQISQEEVSATAEPNIPVLLPQSRDTISFEDLELFHHFVTETHRTLVDEATDRHRIWQTHLPKWGFSSPSIFHLILTMAALHKGHLYPEIREQYVMQADSHFTFGIRSVSAILSSLDSDNCQLIYMSAVLICLVYFAHGPRTGEYLVFSETGKAEWLVLMRGVRSILTSNREKIFTGVLEIQIDPTVQGVSPLLQTELREHQFRIEEVRRFIEMKLGEGSCGIYLGALDNLMEMFEESYQTLSAGKDGICLMSFVVGWIYRLPEEFVGLLEEKDPISLIILAYWCVLLKFMKSSWLMIGWDRHVLGGIQASLSEDLHRWIEWPVRVICG